MRILVVEDEKVAARRLARLVKEVLGDKTTTVDIRESLEESQQYLARHSIDILLLDLNLSGQNGFDLLTRAVAESFQTIIVSANTDQAIRAYEYGVLDFVPKPFEKERLMRAFERLEKPPAQPVPQPAQVLVVRNQGRLQIIPVDQVLYLQGAGDYAEIHLRDGGVALHSKSLESLERILPGRFSRTHKSYIVDMREVVNVHIHGGGKYELELRDGIVLPLSRSRYKELSERLAQG
ncbi:MAG: response regulator [Chitinivibrionales bacterium]|nr:response regulator [Chitinivibrionales bacterium]MBD3395479.1 response regulator [Chitinivibrionales bacterium]